MTDIQQDFSTVSINIIGKENFQSKNAISRLKNDLKTGTNILKEYSKYLKQGYMFTIHKDETNINNIIIKVVNIEENDRNVKNKMYFEMKMKELKEKRLSENSQKNIFDKAINKAKLKYKIDDEILKLYYDLKRYIDRPILNPTDAYSNKEQYIPIIEELCAVFKGDNPYSKYYNMLLSSLKA